MRRRVTRVGWAGVVLLVAAAASSPALALTPRAGQTVVVTGSIQDDLYAAGGRVSIRATVDGDVAAAGGSVYVDGPVSGGVLAAGGSVRVGPTTVGRTVRAAAVGVSVGAQVGGDVVAAGSAVTVETTAGVGRDVAVSGGNVWVLGEVSRNLWAAAGTVTIAGSVGADAHVEADRIVLLPTARIGGRLLYRSDAPPELHPGARVAGGIERLAGARARSRPLPVPRAAVPLLRLLEGLWLLVTGLVAFSLAPRAAARICGEVGRRFGWSLLLGFALLVGAPPSAILLLFTVIGIPLSVLGMLAYFAALYVGQAFFAGWLGGALLRRVRREGTVASPYGAVALGTLALVVLSTIPYVGWLIRVVAALVGFGAMGLAAFGAATAQATEPTSS
ncbi:MAG: hypothetical protein QN163_00020 [Armatimonadota bacterium]|nr:hypothetical protein [Armatimonadota bacterium]MDR5696781.1 hypothetical protein [Armatimonadota bacterium]